MRKIMDIITAALLMVTIYVGVINFCKPEFWEASAGQLLTPLCAICLTFYAAQLKTDQREAKKHAETLIEKIQNIVTNECFCQFPVPIEDEEKLKLRKEVQLANRKLSNSIRNLTTYGTKLGFKVESEYIRNEFDQYRRLVDENLPDFVELAKLKTALKMHAENIDSKCDEIITKLYS